MAVQVTQRQRVSRWVGKRDLRLDPEVAIDADQFARVQRAPSRVLVHRLAREHDDRSPGCLARICTRVPRLLRCRSELVRLRRRRRRARARTACWSPGSAARRARSSVATIRFNESDGRCSATQPDGRDDHRPRTSPSCRRISRVISANSRSESVIPMHERPRSSASSAVEVEAGRPSTPLWANRRPSCSNGWVFASVIAPRSRRSGCARGTCASAHCAPRRRSRCR